MLPVIATEQHVTKQILIYTWATVLATLVLVPAAGVVYAAVALLAGAWFVFIAHQLYNSVRGGGASVKPLKLFLQSNNYLAVVCLGLAVDSVLDLPRSPPTSDPWPSAPCAFVAPGRGRATKHTGAPRCSSQAGCERRAATR